MGQANRRGSYEERKAQGIERKEAERIEREKVKAVREQERMERVRAKSLLDAKANVIRPRGKSNLARASVILALMGGIGQI